MTSNTAVWPRGTSVRTAKRWCTCRGVQCSINIKKQDSRLQIEREIEKSAIPLQRLRVPCIDSVKCKKRQQTSEYLRFFVGKKKQIYSLYLFIVYIVCCFSLFVVPVCTRMYVQLYSTYLYMQCVCIMYVHMGTHMYYMYVLRVPCTMYTYLYCHCIMTYSTHTFIHMQYVCTGSTCTSVPVHVYMSCTCNTWYINTGILVTLHDMCTSSTCAYTYQY